jgi:geranylgeranyl diphosphate synthase type I
MESPAPSDASSDYARRVQTELDAALTHLRTRFANRAFADADQGVGLLLDGFRAATRGGKRLRSRLVEAGWEAAGAAAWAAPSQTPAPEPGPTVRLSPAAILASRLAEAEAHRHAPRGSGPTDRLAVLGAAVELFQASALVHDDIIDRAEVRRGQPAAHVRYAATHRQQGWAGEPVHTGAGLALLLGDTLLVEANAAVLRATAPGPETPRPNEAGIGATVARLWAEMCREVMAGQFLDTLAPHLPLATPDRALPQAMAILRAKSARYSVTYPLALGLAAGGAKDPISHPLVTDYAEPLGEAFQLRDDTLGWAGDPARTGKPAADLEEAKRTPLVALARAGLADGERAEFDALFTGEATAASVARLSQLIEASGAPARVEAMIRDRRDGALAAAERGGYANAAGLVRVAHELTDRQS